MGQIFSLKYDSAEFDRTQVVIKAHQVQKIIS